MGDSFLKHYGIVIGICVSVTGVLLLGVSITLYVLFGVNYRCPNLPVLHPGAQGSCNRSKDKMYVKAIVFSRNATNATKPNPLITYVFDKEPKRSYLTETYSYKLEGTTYFSVDMPLVPGAVYTWKINVDVEMDLKFYAGKRSSSTRKTYYSVSDVMRDQGTYVGDSENSGTAFILSSYKKATGTFSITVKWPQWDINSVTPVDTCIGDDCEWKFSNYTWAIDKDLWFVTLNNATEDILVSMSLKPNFALWITVPILLMIIGVAGFIGGFTIISHAD